MTDVTTTPEPTDQDVAAAKDVIARKAAAVLARVQAFTSGDAFASVQAASADLAKTLGGDSSYLGHLNALTMVMTNLKTAVAAATPAAAPAA